MTRLTQLRILGYVATIVMHISNFLYLAYRSCPTDDPYVKHFKSLEYRFFTTWTFLLQIAYALYALTCELFLLKNAKTKDYQLPTPISDLREILFAGLVWPCSMVVFTVFWGLYSIDRALIFPEFLDAVIPPISNHIIHTMIVPVALWEVFTRPRKEPENHARNISQLTLHLCVYVSVTMSHHIYFRILGYLITIVMHTSNMLVMLNSFHGEPMKNDYVRHFSEMQYFFFTCWTFTFQTIYAVLGLSTDVLTLKNSKSPKYEPPKLVVEGREAMFSILVWPSTVLVFTIFWSFFYYDRNLFFPEDIDLVITNTSNHIMHTYILPATLWEVMFRSRRPPKSHRWQVLGVLMVAVVYFRVLFMVHAIRGVWVYPIFGVLSGSILFYLFILFVLAYLPVIYYTQWTLNSVIHGVRGANKKVY